MAKTPPLAVRIDPAHKAALKQIARDDGRSLSSLIAKIVADWLRERPGKGRER